MGYGDARVRGNPERWKPLRRDEPSNSLPLSVFIFSVLVISILLSSSLASAFSSSSLSPSVSLFLSFPLPPSFSISLIPISSFSSFPPSPTLFRRLNQPAEETTRRGGAGGSRRGRRERPEKDRWEGREGTSGWWTQAWNTQWRRRIRKCGIFDGLSEAVSVISGRFVCATHTALPTSIYLPTIFVHPPRLLSSRPRRLAALYASHARACTHARARVHTYPNRSTSYKFYDQSSVDMFCRRRLKFSFYIFGAREIGKERERTTRFPWKSR